LFDQGDRIEGKSSYNLKSLINLAIEGITCYTMSPLRIAAVLGFIVSIIAFVYLLFVLTKTLLYGEAVQGFPTLLCTILFIGGIQLIAMGIIGEYVGRIFTETKKRPVYIVESYNGKKI
jgi:glycosyltransferase involved in cell wall biosynthesis